MKTTFLTLVFVTVALSNTAMAQKKYDPGASDKEIKIGNIIPYSGPASSYATFGRAYGAYFDKVNAEGGVNGRMIKFISLDDGYNPAKTVEQARKLVEQEEVLLIFGVLGTPTNTAIHKYMNDKHVPHLFILSGATKWGDPKNFPWTMGFQPSLQSEGKNFIAHLLETKPNGKIAVLYQNDDFGKDSLKGIEDALGDKARSMIVAKATYEASDVTVDSQMISLQASGADVFFNFSLPKFAAQAIRKAADLGWKPQHYLTGSSTSITATMVPAGPTNGIGVITGLTNRPTSDPLFQKGKEYEDWLAWMRKYYPAGDVTDGFNASAYTSAQAVVQVLQQAGDNLTHDNVMKQAANLDIIFPMQLPGINVKTAPDDYFPVEREQLARFNGKSWELFGKVYGR